MNVNPLIVSAYFKKCGLPEPVTEHKFFDSRRWRFDFAWPKKKVALEVEGGVWIRGRHNRGVGFIADCEKYNTAASMGWRVLRVLPKQVTTIETVELIKRAMEAEYCADCGKIIGCDSGPPDGWQLEDGRTVCQSCCVKDLRDFAKNDILR